MGFFLTIKPDKQVIKDLEETFVNNVEVCTGWYLEIKFPSFQTLCHEIPIDILVLTMLSAYKIPKGGIPNPIGNVIADLFHVYLKQQFAKESHKFKNYNIV